MLRWPDLMPMNVERGEPLSRDSKGGNGQVFRLRGDARFVLKVYKARLAPRDAARIDRLIAAQTPDLDACAAWPIRRMLSEGADAIVLRLVDGASDIHVAFDRESRIAAFPAATWEFTTRVARNFAEACARVHAAGLVIVDVSERNAMVRADGSVVLIDCDSFVFAGKGAESVSPVLTPDWSPPELTPRTVGTTPRTVDHDNYGIARLCWKLLFQGSDPMMTPSDGDEAGAAPAFAFSRQRPLRGPLPFELTLDDVPAEIGSLFERAFAARGSASPPRPTAAEWAAALGRMGAAMRTCPQVPTTHRFVSTLGRPCPWCVRAGRGANCDDFRQIVRPPPPPPPPPPPSPPPPQPQPARTPVARPSLVRRHPIAAAILVGLLGWGAYGWSHAHRTDPQKDAAVQTKPAATAGAPAVPNRAADRLATLEERSRSFVETYFQNFEGRDAVPFLTSIYADRVRYFGKDKTRDAVLREHVGIVNYWETRSYRPRWSTFSADCDRLRAFCMVSIITDFNVGTAKGHVNNGAWRYGFTLDLSATRAIIVGEDGGRA